MITTTQMYWLVKLDDIRRFISGIIPLPIIIAAVGGIIIIVLTLIYLLAGNGRFEMFEGKSNEQFEDIRKKLWCWRGKCIKLVIAGTGVAITLQAAYHLVPTTKQMAAMVVVPEIVNSEKVQTVGNKIYDLAVAWMNELRPDKTDKTDKTDKSGRASEGGSECKK